MDVPEYAQRERLAELLKVAGGLSTAERECVADYFKTLQPKALSNENRQIYQDSIFEVEAREVGDYARQQLHNIARDIDLLLIQQKKNQHD